MHGVKLLADISLGGAIDWSHVHAEQLKPCACHLPRTSVLAD